MVGEAAVDRSPVDAAAARQPLDVPAVPKSSISCAFVCKMKLQHARIMKMAAAPRGQTGQFVTVDIGA
jgi:hypothetical protein